MITDKFNMFSEGQADITTAATTLCQKSIDLGHAKGTSGSKLKYFYVRVGTAWVGGTSIQPQLVCADNAALSTNLTVIDVGPVVATAALTINTTILKLPMPRKIPRRYLGMQFVSLGTFSAGTLDAGLADEVPTGQF